MRTAILLGLLMLAKAIQHDLLRKHIDRNDY